MERREFLKRSLTTAAGTALFGTIGRAASPPKVGLAGLDRLTGRVILPGQADYDTARQDHNGRISRLPAVIVYCQSAADVAHALQWAREQHVPLRARCGGHSYEGYSLVNAGVVIDISEMQTVQLDATHRTVRVGAGINLGNLYAALWPNRVTIPGGSCGTVGIAGLTLGGGHGLLARHLGLTCDSLLEAEVVTADGKTIRATPTQHADLFWACRGGGGGNFGIVTAFVFRLHPIDSVSIYNITWDWADLEAVLRAWQGWASTVDERLTSILKLKALADGTLTSVGQFVGSSAALTALLAPLRTAGPPKTVEIKTVSYMEAVETFAGVRPDHTHWQVHWPSEHPKFKHSSDYADRLLGPEAIKTLRHFLETAPEAVNLVQMEAYGGAINHLAPTATAFCHRAGTLFSLQYQAYWKQPADEAKHIAWVAAFRQAMQPFVSGRAYSNYCDSDITDWAHAYYGPNLARLQQIKARYDPGSLFQFPQSIPASG